LEGFVRFEPRSVVLKVKFRQNRCKIRHSDVVPYRGKIRPVPRLPVLYLGISLKTEKNSTEKISG